MLTPTNNLTITTYISESWNLASATSRPSQFSYSKEFCLLRVTNTDLWSSQYCKILYETTKVYCLCYLFYNAKSSNFICLKRSLRIKFGIKCFLNLRFCLHNRGSCLIWKWWKYSASTLFFMFRLIMIVLEISAMSKNILSLILLRSCDFRNLSRSRNVLYVTAPLKAESCIETITHGVRKC